MKDNLDKKFDTVIEVNTTYIATEAGHPRVYYKIKPEIGYVVCGYCNICFILKDDADLDTDTVFFYDERKSKLEEKLNVEERGI